MIVLENIIFFLSGIIVGLISSLFGIGGGTILVPLFSLGFGYTIHEAIAASLVIIVPTALIGAYRHMQTNKLDWMIVLMIVAGGLIGSNTGVNASLALPELLLRRLFVGLLLFVSIQMLLTTRRESRPEKKKEVQLGEAGSSDLAEPGQTLPDSGDVTDLDVSEQETQETQETSDQDRLSIWRVLAYVVTGVVTGFVSSLFGIGGGIIIVPILTLMLKMRIHQAVTVSLAVIVPISIIGAVRHAIEGNVPWMASLFVIIGGLLGAHFGASWGGKLSERRLKRLFAVFLIVMAARMFF